MSSAFPPETGPDLTIGTGHALPPGARLEYFEIERVLSVSSFGIIYLATDLSLRTTVAIKEYMPIALSTRGRAGQVVLRGPSHAESYHRGLQAFMNEARTLARCDHPALLRVSRLWVAQATAYRAMPHYAGHSMLGWRHALKEPPPEAQLRVFLSDLLGAIETLSDAGVVHRRIAPFNILVRPDGRPLLLDFDAVRHAMLSDKSQSLMAALDPSYAPIEPSTETDESVSPISADLYALTAVMHFAISGLWPTSLRLDSARREPLSDVLERLRENAPQLDYSADFIDAIDSVLAMAPKDRPQTAAELRAIFRPRPQIHDRRSALAPSVPPTLTTVSPPDEATLDAAKNLRRPGPAVESADGSSVSSDRSVTEPLHGWNVSSTPAAAATPYVAPTSPLNSSASVLELLANFERRPGDVSAPVEPFRTPQLPVLTEEAPPRQTSATEPAPLTFVAAAEQAAVAREALAAASVAAASPPLAAQAPVPTAATTTSAAASASAPTASATTASPVPSDSTGTPSTSAPLSQKPSAQQEPPPLDKPVAAASARPPVVDAELFGAGEPSAFHLDDESDDEPAGSVDLGMGDSRWMDSYLSVTEAQSRPPKRSAQRFLPWLAAVLIIVALAGIGWKVNDQRHADSVLTELAENLKEHRPDEEGKVPASRSESMDIALAPALEAASAAASVAQAASLGLPTSARHGAATASVAPEILRAPSSSSSSSSSAPVSGSATGLRSAARPASGAEQRADAAKPATAPRDECRNRTEFALYRCMQTQCAQQRWAQHAQCKALKSSDEIN